MLASNTYTEEGLAALFLFWVAITVAAAAAMYWVLLKIEAQIAADMLNSYAEGAGNLELSVEDNKQKDYTSMDSPSKKKQLELEVEMTNMSCSATDFDPQLNSYASIHNDGGCSPRKNKANDSESEKPIRCMAFSSSTLRISHFRKVILAFLTIVLVLLNYLLMVLSSAPEFLSFLGLALVSVLVLQRQILEEIRSARYDRLSCLVTVMLIATMSMNLASYAAKEVASENMYQGPARIVGYDTSKYETLKGGKDTTSTKTDLEVAWGDKWACPNSPDKECRAVVDGALCEMDDNSTSWDDDANGGTDKAKITEEVYYDKNGKKVDKEKDQDTYTDKNGKVVYDYKAEQTTQYNGGKVENFEEDSSDTEYDSNGKVEESEQYKQSVNYTETGKVQDGTYSYQDTEYADGKKVEDYQEAEENEQTESGGDEDVYETLDVDYNTDGTVKEEEYTASETEKDAAGQKTDEFNEEIDVENDENGKLEDEFVEEDEETYKDGKVVEEEEVFEDVAENSDGTESYEVEDETVKYNKDGGYNVTLEEDYSDGTGQYDVENETMEVDKDGDYNVTVEDAVYSKNGTMIEDEKESYGSGGNRGLLLRRRLEDQAGLENELEEEEEENEELQEENDELEKENEELQKELNEENGGKEHEDDDWGETDWSSVWGDYKCYNLFDADLNGVKFNPHKRPGSDDWPYLNIFGNCKTCEAYIVDYYSTEHFQSIQSYKKTGKNFGIAASLSLVLTLVFALKQRLSPKGDNSIELLATSSKRGTFS